MATNYPGSLDNFTNPTSASPINSPSHADQHSNANDAIEAIEGELGANPKGAKATVKARLDDVDTAIATKAPIASPTFTGTVTIPAGSAITGVPYLATANTFTTTQTITPSSTSEKSLIISSASGTVNMQEWVANDGTAYIDNQGRAIFRGIGTNYTSTVGPNTMVFANSISPGVIGLIVKAAASQTANLQEWQNSGGTVLSNINSAGAANFVRAGIGGTTPGTTPLFVTSPNASYIATIIRAASGQTANITEWQDSSGGLLTAINNSGQIATFGRLTVGSSVVSTDARMVLLNTGTTTSVLQIIRGIASQTADLTQWQNSAGTVLAKVTSTGDATLGYAYLSGLRDVNGTGAYLNMQASTSGILVNTRAAANIGLIVKGSTSQTADLQQWQNSAGDVKSRINSAGTFLVTGGSYIEDTGRTFINSSSAAYIPLTVRGTTSQTGNLQEWQDSSGTVLAKVDATGVGRFPYIRVGSTLDGLYSASISNLDPSLVGLAIRGAASQNTSLQEWQNNGGTTLARINQFGDFYITGGRIFRGNQDLGANLNILNESDLKGMVVKSVSGQTKNLIELQSSTGAVLSGINPIGQLFIRSTTPITASAVSQAITSVSFTSTTATYTFSATEQTISIGEYVTVFGITPSGYNGTYQVTSVATVSAGSSYSFTVANTTNDTVTVGTGYFFPSASVSISTQNKAHTGLIIKAVSGQTSSVMEIQNSLGQPTTWWDSTGGMTASQAVVSTLYSGGFMNTGSLGYFNATTFSPSVSPIVVRGAASQTANLQQWQNSAGTLLARVSSGGAFVTSAVGVFGAQSNTPNAQLYVLANSTTLPTFVAKATESQTGNLTQWQNSAGTVLSSFSSGGRLAINTTADAGGRALYVVQPNGGYGSVFEGVGTVANVSIYAAAGGVGLIVAAAASQTADLTQWQDSAGTVLTSITPLGNLNLTGVTGTTTATAAGLGDKISLFSSLFGFGIQAYRLVAYVDNGSAFSVRGVSSSGNKSSGTDSVVLESTGQGRFLLNSASTVGLIVKGFASQTADLQQWQNSAGTVLTNVRSDGAILITKNGDPATGVAAPFMSSPVNSGYSSAAVYSFWYQSGTGISNPYVQTLGINTNAIERMRFTSDGLVLINSSSSTLGGGSVASQLGVVIAAATTVGAVIRGAASQTANLQEWQNSAGTVLTSISSAGKLTSAVDASINGMTIGLGGGSGPTNIALGGSALLSNTTGFGNSAIGLGALQSNTTGWGNVGIGTYALQNYSGNVNTAIGYLALRNATQEGLVAIGYGALASNTSGGANTAVGYAALNANITGGANTAFGSQSSRLSTGDRNTSVGFYSAYGLTTGTDNTFLGSQTGQSFTTGSSNIAIGSYNSWYGTSTGSGNTFVGTDGGGQPVTGSNNTTLGYQSTISSSSVSNEITLGNSSVTRFRIPGIGLNITSNSTINTASAATVGLIVKGAASQTANLQEWHNSDGTVLSRITNGGGLRIESLVASSIGGAAVAGTILLVHTNQPANLGLVVKAAASQTANLQEWQNSAGTVLTRIDSAGSLISGVVRTTVLRAGDWASLPSGTVAAFSTCTTASTVGFIVKAAASQSADLQQWQDSNGTVLTAITQSGAIKSNISSTISANTATTVDTVALSSFTTTEYTISIKQGSKVRSSKVLVHTDGTSVDSTEYGIIEMGGGITGILVTASVSSTNSILQVTITDAATTNATVKLIKTML